MPDANGERFSRRTLSMPVDLGNTELSAQFAGVLQSLLAREMAVMRGGCDRRMLDRADARTHDAQPPRRALALAKLEVLRAWSRTASCPHFETTLAASLARMFVDTGSVKLRPSLFSPPTATRCSLIVEQASAQPQQPRSARAPPACAPKEDGMSAPFAPRARSKLTAAPRRQDSAELLGHLDRHAAANRAGAHKRRQTQLSAAAAAHNAAALQQLAAQPSQRRADGSVCGALDSLAQLRVSTWAADAAPCAPMDEAAADERDDGGGVKTARQLPTSPAARRASACARASPGTQSRGPTRQASEYGGSNTSTGSSSGADDDAELLADAHADADAADAADADADAAARATAAALEKAERRAAAAEAEASAAEADARVAATRAGAAARARAASRTVPTSFEWRGRARPNSVFVAGSFNGWSEQIPLRCACAPADWYVTLSLPPGEHAFRFVVEGEWRLSEDARVVDIDGQGSLCNGLTVLDAESFVHLAERESARARELAAADDDEDAGFGQSDALLDARGPPDLPPVLRASMLGSQLMPGQPGLEPRAEAWQHTQLNRAFARTSGATDLLPRDDCRPRALEVSVGVRYVHPSQPARTKAVTFVLLKPPKRAAAAPSIALVAPPAGVPRTRSWLPWA